MINILGKKKQAFIVSLAFIGIAIFAIFVWGLKFGIDFTGGTLLEVKFSEKSLADGDICASLPAECRNNFIIQKSDGNRVLIRYGESSAEFNKEVQSGLISYDKDIEFLKTDFIGATISEQLKDNALSAIILSIFVIIIYIAWAFRKISFPVSSWGYGLGAIIALVHDILIILGVFAFLGYYYGIEVGVPFIAALLTVLGYSVNDTIVVYDRIRENILRTRDIAHFDKLINKSLNETLARSLNTSITVIVVLVAMIFWGSSSLVWFCVALLIGVIVGTYSSIFIATAFVYSVYEYKIEHRLLGRLSRFMSQKSENNK